MTPAERAICALNLGKPDEIPTFELEFQLSREFFGYELDDDRLHPDNIGKYSEKEIEKFSYELADKYARVYGDKTAYDIGGAALSGNEELDSRPGLDYCIIPVYSPDWDDADYCVTKYFRKRLREHFGSTRLFGGHGDGTFAIPSGRDMYDFVYRLADEPDAVKADAKRMCLSAIERNKRQHEAGLDVALLCSDYCYNSGPYLSPTMMNEFVFPYLAEIIAAGKADGMYMIKHTDGNIMPILDDLVRCAPHALHSIDPMAGVDIREVKRLVGDKVALCGNVHCAAMQTGTDDEVRQSTEYCLKYGGENGGYIFCTSNIPFKGMPPERYKMVLDIWKKHRKY
ncbi:MAG: hypothetical protein MJ177_05325 [Clostridia bacterium]|nr:hypothetical protein [Clostridia bacterium]